MRFNFNYIWIYAGLVGFLIYLGLYRSFDIFAGNPIQLTSSEVKELAHDTLSDFHLHNASLDTLQLIAFPFFNLDPLKDENGFKEIAPFDLNRRNYQLTGWRVPVTNKFDMPAFAGYQELSTNQNAVLTFFFSQSGQLIKVTGSSNAFFTSSDITELAKNIKEKWFGLHSEDWELKTIRIGADTLDYSKFLDLDFSDIQNQEILVAYHNSRNLINLQEWSLTIRANEAETIEFVLAGFEKILENPSSGQFFENQNLALVTFSFLVSFIVFLIVVIGQIFKGEIIWKRVIIIALIFTALYNVWRILILKEFFSAMTLNSALLDIGLSSLILAIYGFLIGFAYMAWEAIARKYHHHQIILFDAAWKGRFLFKETGMAVILGYATAGITLAIFSLAVIGFNANTLPSDFSGFGFLEAAALWPPLSLWIQSWINSWFIGFVSLGMILCLMSMLLKNGKAIVLLTTLLSAIVIAAFGYFTKILAPLHIQIFIVFLSLLPLVFAARYIGMFSMMTALGLLFGITSLMPFHGESSALLTVSTYSTAGIFLLPLLLAFVAYYKNDSVNTLKEFVPDYEQKVLQQARYESEVKMAKDSQTTLLPSKPPKYPGIDVDGFFIPSLEVGGDFYDYQLQASGDGEADKLIFSVADVSGKGMKAAMNAIFTSGLILARETSDNPSQVLNIANQVLFQKTEKQVFVTCTLASLNLETYDLTIVNAGNCRPLLYRNGDVSEVVTNEPRFPLGMKSDVFYSDTHIPLRKGDVLLLYSDGLPEAKNEDGEFFEDEKIAGLLKEINPVEKSASELCEIIRKEILIFSNYELADDVTLIVLKIV